MLGIGGLGDRDVRVGIGWVGNKDGMVGDRVGWGIETEGQTDRVRQLDRQGD